jgi:hypothetical protein
LLDICSFLNIPSHQLSWCSRVQHGFIYPHQHYPPATPVYTRGTSKALPSARVGGDTLLKAMDSWCTPVYTQGFIIKIYNLTSLFLLSHLFSSFSPYPFSPSLFKVQGFNLYLHPLSLHILLLYSLSHQLRWCTRV